MAAQGIEGRILKKAKNQLKAMRAQGLSYAQISKALGGLNRGLLSGVVNGKREATPQLLKALGLPLVSRAYAPVCPLHGVVHLRQSCPRVRPTFEENARAWVQWQREHRSELRQMVAWATNRLESERKGDH